MSALARAVLIRCVQVAFSLEDLDTTQPLQLSPTSLVELLLCRLLKCGGHARFAIGLLRPIGLLPRIPRTDPNRTGVDNGQDRSGLNPLDSLAHFRVKRWQSPLLATSRLPDHVAGTSALPPTADLASSIAECLFLTLSRLDLDFGLRRDRLAFSWVGFPFGHEALGFGDRLLVIVVATSYGQDRIDKSGGSLVFASPQAWSSCLSVRPLAPSRFAAWSTAPVRCVPIKTANRRSTPFRLARFKLAPFKSAPISSAPTKLAPFRSAPLRLAWSRFAPLRLAFDKSAPLRSVLGRSAWARLAPLSLAHPRLASDKSAQLKSALERSALIRLIPPRSARIKLTPWKLAPLRLAPLRSAPIKLALLRSAPLKLTPGNLATFSLAPNKSHLMQRPVS